MSKNRHSEEQHFDRALKDGKLVHVDTVLNGLSCNCICPSCGTTVVAYNNPTNKKAHHFKHHSLNDCRNYYETMLHYLAKQVIQTTGKLTVPNITFELSDYASSYFENYSGRTVRPKTLSFDSVELEKHSNGIIPDVICKVGDRALFIEIAVTHFVDEERKGKIEQQGIPTLEIDLSNVDRSLQQEELIKTLNGNTKLMTWIHNPAIEKRRRIYDERVAEARMLLMENISSVKIYGKKQRIYSCPQSSKEYEVDLGNCNNCRYKADEIEEFEYKPEFDSERPYQPQQYVRCIGSGSKAFYQFLDKYGVKYRENKAFGK